MRIAHILGAAAIAACLLAPRPAAADDLKTVARATAAKSGKAVVTVKLVIKIKMGGREQEQKLEILGTVIDPSGLTVASAAAVEPTSLLGQLGRRGGRGGGGGGGEMPRVESEVSDTAIVLEDGTEVEADVVLKDADLDLAFIRPREPQKLEAVELKPRGKPLAILEDVFTVTRLGRAEGRATSIETGAVKAVVKGPRTYYVCTRDVSSGQGCIAYAADGAPVGIFVVRVNADAGEGGGFGRGGGRDIATAVLRPIEDVLEIAKQAKEAKVPERKPAAVTPPADKPAKESPAGEAPKTGEKTGEVK